MSRRKRWRTIRVGGDEFHWKVCQPNFESRPPTTTHPCDVVIQTERSRGATLWVRFPLDPAEPEVALTPGTIRAIIDSAMVVGWERVCAERGYWLRGMLATYDQWVDILRVERPDLPSAVRSPRR